MKKLKLDNFKIAELTNPNFIKGGIGDDGGGETGQMACVDNSNRYVYKKKSSTLEPEEG